MAAREWCHTLGLHFVTAPPETRDAQGFLAERYFDDVDVTLAERLDQLRLVAGASPVDLKALHALLTLLFSKVVIDWPKETLCIHWKHGGQSTVKAAMKAAA